MRVNTVSDRLVETDMGQRLTELIPGPDDMREHDAMMPFGYVCQPADVAAAATHLLSEDARYGMNQLLTVNGGGF